MGSRPSAPLLKLILQTARKKGWNTATLANAAKLDRSRLKSVLAGREPMTVDELIQLSGAMDISAADLGIQLPTDNTPEPEPEPEPADAPAPTPLGLAALPTASASDPEDGAAEDGPAEDKAFPDPFGNHAEQIIQLGFMLGCDIFFTAQTDQLSGSGVPSAVIERFQPSLPIRLESAFHRHNAPEYFPEGLQVRLSFDSVYTCLFPWTAIKQITLFPTPPASPGPEPKDDPSAGRKVSHLRLIE
ncbi:MAG: hypothetical protein AAFV53_38545 [Myxococcota bacterium]